MAARKVDDIRRLGACGDLVLVCRKCSKKMGGGFGPDGRRSLAKALRKALDGRSKPSLKKRDRAAMMVMETGCLDLCPKNAVVALHPGPHGHVVIVPAGTEVARVAVALGLS